MGRLQFRVRICEFCSLASCYPDSRGPSSASSGRPERIAEVAGKIYSRLCGFEK